MSRWTTASEKHRAAVERNAERHLDDVRFDRVRTPAGLGALVAANIVTTILVGVLWWTLGGIAGILAVTVWGAVFLLLRIAVRAQADLPDEVLDERMRRERDQVYVVAYRGAIGVIFLAANALFVSVAFRDDGATVTLGYDQVGAIYWTLFAVVVAAPSIALALHRRRAGRA
jgi:hypothetical protein